jgi:hypothetical protein
MESKHVRSLLRLPGVDEGIALKLIQAGLRTLPDVYAASDEQIKAAAGLSKAKVAKIREYQAVMRAKRDQKAKG